MASNKNPFFEHLKGEEIKMNKLKQFVNDEEGKQQCSTCNSELEVVYSSKNLPYDYNGEERYITILNAPYRRCKACDENLENFRLYSLLRELLEQEIFFKLNKREEIPGEVDLFKI